MSQGAWKGRKDGARREIGLTFGEGSLVSPRLRSAPGTAPGTHAQGSPISPISVWMPWAWGLGWGRPLPRFPVSRLLGPRTHQTLAHPFLGGCGFSWWILTPLAGWVGKWNRRRLMAKKGSAEGPVRAFYSPGNWGLGLQDQILLQAGARPSWEERWSGGRRFDLRPDLTKSHHVCRTEASLVGLEVGTPTPSRAMV